MSFAETIPRYRETARAIPVDLPVIVHAATAHPGRLERLSARHAQVRLDAPLAAQQFVNLEFQADGDLLRLRAYVSRRVGPGVIEVHFLERTLALRQQIAGFVARSRESRDAARARAVAEERTLELDTVAATTAGTIADPTTAGTIADPRVRVTIQPRSFQVTIQPRPRRHQALRVLALAIATATLLLVLPSRAAIDAPPTVPSLADTGTVPRPETQAVSALLADGDRLLAAGRWSEPIATSALGHYLEALRQAPDLDVARRLGHVCDAHLQRADRLLLAGNGIGALAELARLEEVLAMEPVALNVADLPQRIAAVRHARAELGRD